MRYRPLGPSGLVVSELCLGTMTFGGSGDDLWAKIGQLDQDAADTLVKTALEAGINFIDTANVYAGGASERILGQALKNLDVARDDVVIATKVLSPMGSGPNRRGASRGHILSLQAYYTLVGRDIEREIVPMLRSEGLGLMVWSPLAGGLLSGKYARDDEASGDGRRANFDFPPVDRERAWPLLDTMRDIANAHSASVAQIALAWLLHQPVVTTVIIGARGVDQLMDNIGATDLRLSDDELARLDGLSRLPSEYPGWMLEHQGADRVAMLGSS